VCLSEITGEGCCIREETSDWGDEFSLYLPGAPQGEHPQRREKLFAKGRKKTPIPGGPSLRLHFVNGLQEERKKTRRTARERTRGCRPAAKKRQHATERRDRSAALPEKSSWKEGKSSHTKKRFHSERRCGSQEEKTGGGRRRSEVLRHGGGSSRPATTKTGLRSKKKRKAGKRKKAASRSHGERVREFVKRKRHRSWGNEGEQPKRRADAPQEKKLSSMEKILPMNARREGETCRRIAS